MTDDLRGNLREGAGSTARRDHAAIRRRASRLALVRFASLLGIVAVVVGLAGIMLGMGSRDAPTLPVTSEPPGDAGEEHGGNSSDEGAAPNGPPLVCAAPTLRPNYLPWLDEGEEVPAPVVSRHGTEREATGFAVWVEEPDEYDAESPSDTNSVSIATVADYDPRSLQDMPDVEVRGHPAKLVWVGDPGVGPVTLIWQEGHEPCGVFALSLLLRTGDEAPDHLELERSFAEAVEADGGDAAILEVQQAIEAQVHLVAESLVEADDQ